MHDTLEHACKTASWARLDWTRNRLLEYNIERTPRWQTEVMDDRGGERSQTNAKNTSEPKVRMRYHA
jgi:hypothetical protein